MRVKRTCMEKMKKNNRKMMQIKTTIKNSLSIMLLQILISKTQSQGSWVDR